MKILILDTAVPSPFFLCALAKFGYRSHREVENFKNPAVFWKPAGTYHLNMMISEKYSSKSGNFGAFFPQKSFV
jgi:hypothetical protein